MPRMNEEDANMTTKNNPDIEEARAVATQMIKHGGGFSKMLGTKLAQMDIEDIEEFKSNWPSYWKRYAKMAEVD